MEGYEGDSTITAWEPPSHFAFRGDAAPDGTFHALEYRSRGATAATPWSAGSTVDSSGRTTGSPSTTRCARATHVPAPARPVREHFLGRKTTAVAAMRMGVDPQAGMATLRAAMGLGDDVAEGAAVDFAPAGLPKVDGVVDFVSPGSWAFGRPMRSTGS